MISFSGKGDFSNLTNFLERGKEVFHLGILDKYGKMGVEALSQATPVDTGKTAASWSYKIENRNGSAAIAFFNSNIQNGVHVAVVLDTGHATKGGGWVEGRDYISPAIQPIFDQLAEEAWKEVTRT